MLASPLLLEVEAAFRRYEESQSLAPESPRRPLAKLRRGMNWDARFAGWVGLALLAGLVGGVRWIWLGPVVFEALLTIHRVLPHLLRPRRPGRRWGPPLPVIMPPPPPPSAPPGAGV